MLQMSDAIINVENLSKRYLVGHQSSYRKGSATFREMIARETHNFALKAIDFVRGRRIIQGDEVEEFWALRNVSFDIKQGEVVGVIGRNGAGKSTLLKILSRITKPTEGRIVLRGRVASLLEVGTGFHPELTGRENIFLNGAILGMTQREIRKKFDEIVAFAEVERFLDTPVKRYSSGMYVRLAFAVAAHLEPEILIVDEVLALGDAEFQQKCLGKIDEASRREGRTVLFVSHNMGVVTSLCPSAIWLDQGLIRKQGAARQVIGDYLALALPNQNRFVKLDHIPRHHRNENRVRLLSLEWLSDLPLQHGEPIRGRIQFRALAPLNGVTVDLGFSNPDGSRLLTYKGLHPGPVHVGDHRVEFQAESLPLSPDVYYLDIGCSSDDLNHLDHATAALQLEIVAGPKTPQSIVQKGLGVHLPSTWVWADNDRGAGHR
jgi:lipopolysaccharide transport system ATP-binding protein